MKELEKHNADQEVEQRQVKKGERHIGSYRIKPGTRVFELNLSTGEVKEALVDSSYDVHNKKAVRKLMQKEDHIYLPALNKKNAIKKFNRIFTDAKINLRAK